MSKDRITENETLGQAADQVSNQANDQMNDQANDQGSGPVNDKSKTTSSSEDVATFDSVETETTEALAENTPQTASDAPLTASKGSEAPTTHSHEKRPAEGHTAPAANDDRSDLPVDDDEEWLRAFDEKVVDTPEMVLINQGEDGNGENAVVLELLNLYKETGRGVRSGMAMRNDPPIFRVTSADGSQAEFLVTKEMSLAMRDMFGDVSRAYFGMTPKRSIKEKMNPVEFAKKHKVGVCLVAALFALLVLMMVL